MSKSILAGLAAAVLFGCAAPAVAQTAPSAPVIVPSADPEQDEKEALVRRYFEVIQMEKLMNSMMESMVAPMLADARIPEDKIPVVREALLEGFGNVMPQMMDAYVGQYAEVLTLDELRQLVAFYESPVGRSVMAKTVTLSRSAGEMVERFQPVMEAEMMRQLCARIECPASPPVRIVPSVGARTKP